MWEEATSFVIESLAGMNVKVHFMELDLRLSRDWDEKDDHLFRCVRHAVTEELLRV